MRLKALKLGTALALPLYLLFSELGLSNTYWSVLIPSFVSPFGVYLCRIYAAAAVPDSLLEAARIDGAGAARILGTLALRLMAPALVTVFLFLFVLMLLGIHRDEPYLERIPGVLDAYVQDYRGDALAAAKDYPGALPHMLYAGSLVFRRPAGDHFRVRLAFHGIRCEEVVEIGAGDEAAADCWLAGDLEQWREMFADIVEHGHAVGDWTLNTLTLFGDRISLHASDPMGQDRFHRFNQTLQEFVDAAARLGG